ncbi:mas-related G-protein coupled receptor member H-like [Patagioenas fasciata monilis]|uniref:Mas-related G-protein coupled receptor member H-like n=1 Tax=Patagioenas fasciata monilis TaxID=372326 RepID=A0A1V4JPF4_PATFA|nr:mas-related G-protein coupled receptor member H-like [Patagioenas fasciata monilis]
MDQTNITELYLDYTDYTYAYYWPFTPCQFILDDARLVMAFVSVVICLCGLVGNMSVLWFLGFHMKKSPFTVYVLNLAIADFSLLLFLLVILTLFIIPNFSCVFSSEYDFTLAVMPILFLFWYFASMYLLTAISIERCLSGLFPIWYRYHRPRHLSGTVCGGLWALAGFFASLLLICNRTSMHTYLEVLNFVCIGNSVVFSVLPLFSNLFLFIKVRCVSQRRRPGRLYIAILLSAIFLFLFGFPLNVAILLGPFYLQSFYLPVSYLLSSLNSSVNPLIYFLVGSCQKCHFHGSLNDAFRRVFEEKAKNEEKIHVPRVTTAVTTL